MKNKLTFLLLILVTLGLTKKQEAQTLNGHWTLICYSNLLTGTKDCKSSTDRTGTVSLEFKDNGKTGTMFGHTINNSVSGDYTLWDNNKIKVERFGGTKIAEHGWGNGFWTTINQSSSFKYSSDTLVILYDNDTKAMKFLKTTKEK
jgi:hypothetical protein